MGLTAALRRFAFARRQALPVLGRGGALLWRALRDTGAVQLARAPHDADLLVLAGEMPPDWQDSLLALFETLALPRLLLWLRPPWPCALPDLPLGYVATDPARIDWAALTDHLLAADNPAHAPLWPPQSPNRPMAMTLDDRDGLALDDVPTALGPYFPGLPTGLHLTLRMQGDRVRVCEPVKNTFPGWHLQPSALAEEPALQVLTGEAVSIAALERARLVAHLGWLADFLTLAGLDDLGAALHRQRHSGDAAVIEPLLARVDGWLLQKLLRGIGKIKRTQAEHGRLVGPLARASGLERDARLNDPAYRALGFEPCIATGGDVWARVQVRVCECRQSLRLLARAGTRTSRAAEGVRGCFARDVAGQVVTPSAVHLAAVPPLLAGLEWFEAVLCVASLDLDMAEAALT